MFRNLLLLSLCTAGIATAAEMPDAGRLLKESSAAPLRIPQEAPPEPTKEQVTPARSSKQARLTIADFTFTGNTIFSDTELALLIAKYRGQACTFAELEQATTLITQAYRKRGYFLALAYLPPQTLSQGKALTIEITEGVLDTIAIDTKEQQTRIDPALLSYYARQIPTGTPLNDESLTSMIMRTNELPNISSRILLEPGSRPGSTKATLQVSEGKPSSFSVEMDNYGNDATGAHRLSASMELYSPLHFGDQFNLRLQTSTTGLLRNLQSSYAIPVTPYGTKIGLMYSYVSYTMGGEFQALGANGNAHNLTFSLTHPLKRHRDIMLNATFAAEGRVLNDCIESTETQSQRLAGSYQAGLSGVRMDKYFGGGYTSFSLGFIGGHMLINDATTLALDQSPFGLQTNGAFTKLNVTLSRTQRISPDISFYAGSYGQWSNNNLNSSEQLSLGGPSAVRAWLPSEASADRGMISTAEVRYLVDTVGELPGKLELSAFIDHSNAALHSSPLPFAGDNCISMTGVGLGVKWFDTSNYSLQSTVAWKLGETNTTDTMPLVFARFIKSF